MFWKRKTNPSSTEDSETSTLDSSKLDMSMEVDEKTEKSETVKSDLSETPKSLDDSKVDVQEEFAISARQLGLKVTSMCVYERRAGHKKLCWYVKDDILKQYGMEDIQLPNTWEYVCIKPPDVAKTPSASKVDEVSSVSTPGRATPNIMQFAQPMSPSQIQALGPALKDSGKTSESAAMDEEPEVTAVTANKPTVSADQRRIKDMFSPVAKKPVGKKLKNTGSPMLVNVLTSPKTVAKQPSPVAKLSHDSAASVNNVAVQKSGSPKVCTQAPNKSEVDLILIESTSKKSSDPSEVLTTPNSKNVNTTLKSMLSSPELMKPKSSEKIEESKESEDKEQPMEVDIIVLD